MNHAVKGGRIEYMWLLKEGAAYYNFALNHAAKEGQLETMKLLNGCHRF